MATPSTAKPLVRAVFCGAVDDGKSTLLGHLLYGSETATLDEIAFVESSPAIDGDLDFSLFVDGLESEREQGITIDVAHRNLTLPSGHRLMLLDSPGHAQYTRNMAVAAASADIAVLVIDATRGIRDQSLRHALIAELMGVRHIVVVLNKLDAVDDVAGVVTRLDEEFRQRFANVTHHNVTHRSESLASLSTLHVLAISGRTGANVLQPEPAFPTGEWPTLLAALDGLAAQVRDSRIMSLPESSEPAAVFRCAVQFVQRVGSTRRYLGRLSGQAPHVGQRITVFPSGESAQISSVTYSALDATDTQTFGSAVSVELDRDLDVSRGDIIVDAAAYDALPVSQGFLADVVCLSPDGISLGQAYSLISGPTEVACHIDVTRYTVDPETGEQVVGQALGVNDIARVEVSTSRPIVLDEFSTSRETGGFIIVNRATGETVAVGMNRAGLTRKSDVTRHAFTLTRQTRERATGIRGAVLWVTGLPGCGKSTLANALEVELFHQGVHTVILDGDTIRQTLSEDLGFSPEDRSENVRRVSRVAQLLLETGCVVIVTLVSPYRDDRDLARGLFADGDFVEVFVDTPVTVCAERDPKGLYAQAKADPTLNLTGVTSPYEVPEAPEVHIDGTAPVAESLAKLLAIVTNRRVS
jgi:bifunctional enzyme CysN/CysC